MFQFRIPTKANAVPDGEDWLLEIIDGRKRLIWVTPRRRLPAGFQVLIDYQLILMQEYAVT